MVELRWLDRRVPDERIHPMMNVFHGKPRETVLQYRQWQVRIDASGAITPLPMPITWTDWQDVPTVRSDSGRGEG